MTSDSGKSYQTNWRRLLVGLSHTDAIAPGEPDFSFTDITLDKLQEAMQNRELNAQQVVRHYYRQIVRHNEEGADLRAVNQLLPLTDALEIARKLDTEREQGNVRGKLHGIPVLLKDNIDTADGLPNTAGSLLLKEHFPERDAPLVEKLRAAGAIIIGKANLTEWANFRSSGASSGWSSLGGMIKNPYDTTRSTCGSSGGSACAVSSNLIPVAVGSETDGSLVCPAATTGIVAIKPTLGLISHKGIIPIAPSQDTAGPMARTVRDAVYLLDVLVERNADDKRSPSFSEHLKVAGLQGKRIGVARNLMGYHTDLDAAFEKQLNVLRDAGAEIIEEVEFCSEHDWSEDELIVLLHEFKYSIQDYFSQHPQARYHNLDELIAATQQYGEVLMPFFGQQIFALADLRTDEQQADYEAALARAKDAAGKNGIDATLKRHQLDLLIAPTTSPAWKIDVINGDHYLGSASSPAAVAGYPHITVPMGFIGHLPVGMSFFAGAGADALLIEAAYAYEQVSQQRRAPALLPREH
ncbi:amidase [Pseudidiomarina insulisalsae]|uniref:Amidase n=1 Tax=Pseudidiomarina insulisalsae TaxID=575789 RepID=A0A432YHU2_9GAMM|nr:amidase [Pseudidiomarina insulisalsae]RUO60531.1 amidase [Pseudidiomarina insulisalsae]